jgi:hypothetical protein
MQKNAGIQGCRFLMRQAFCALFLGMIAIKLTKSHRNLRLLLPNVPQGFGVAAGLFLLMGCTHEIRLQPKHRLWS